MKIKTNLKLLCVCFALILSLALTSCGGAKDTLVGGTDEILKQIVDGANAAIPEGSGVGMTFDEAVAAENCQGMLGLSSDEFAQYVEDAYASTAALMTFAHEAALVKCKNIADAAKVKELMINGFNSGRWVCVMPDKTYVIESGSYVFLVASKTVVADAFVESFKSAAQGNTGTAVLAFDFSNYEEADGGGGLNLG
ncbi:MAG: DUF4358 domain-containing protein [Oscillospiraceae bacterium]|nr:DUF4358 domain-containing protein [Oscillospiraceae bacterium]